MKYIFLDKRFHVARRHDTETTRKFKYACFQMKQAIELNTL